MNHGSGRMCFHRRGPGLLGAFTLVEMLLVIALLAGVLVLTVEISKVAMDWIARTRSRVAADRIAATVFGQLGLDLQQRLARGETVARVIKQAAGGTGGGSDEIALLTNRPGYPLRAEVADRRVAAVQYRVEDGQLVQAVCGYRYGAPENPPDEALGTLRLHRMANGPAELDAASFRSLVPGVLRMELCAMHQGGASGVLAAPPADLREIDALVVTLAVLDPARGKMLDDSQRETIANEFGDAVDGETPLRAWVEKAGRLAGDLSSAGVPLPALQNVRIYQHCIPVREVPVP